MCGGQKTANKEERQRKIKRAIEKDRNICNEVKFELPMFN